MHLPERTHSSIKGSSQILSLQFQERLYKHQADNSEFWTTSRRCESKETKFEGIKEPSTKGQIKKGEERWINFDLTLVEVGKLRDDFWGKSNGIRLLPEAQIWSCAPTQRISALPITVCVSEDPGCAQYHGVLGTLV